MAQHFVVAAVGENRTGIVSDVSEVIFQSNCNIEDSRMTLLGDQFALLTLVSCKGDTGIDNLTKGCARLLEEKSLAATVFPVLTRRNGGLVQVPSGNYEILVEGLDRSGITYRTSHLLAAWSIDIVDLETRIRSAPISGSPVFTLQAKLLINEPFDEEKFRNDLKKLSDDLVVNIEFDPIS
jgi:glycine cleavage system transcriptional repressor